jgi:CheY-like chemotaxis protein
MAETRPRVLVIDDEPSIRALLSDLLTFLVGADVDVAENGRGGLALFDRARYDLILTDLLMPGIRGWEVAETLRHRDPAVKVIMLTGSANHDDVRRAREGGFWVLTKPVHVQEFKQAIEHVLRGEPLGPSDDRPRSAIG